MYTSILRSFAFILNCERKQDRFNYAREKAKLQESTEVVLITQL